MPTASCGVAAEPDLASLALSPTRRSSRERGPACAPVRRGSRARRCSRPAAVAARGPPPSDLGEVAASGREAASEGAPPRAGEMGKTRGGGARGWEMGERERGERGRKIEYDVWTPLDGS